MSTFTFKLKHIQLEITKFSNSNYRNIFLLQQAHSNSQLISIPAPTSLPKYKNPFSELASPSAIPPLTKH